MSSSEAVTVLAAPRVNINICWHGVLCQLHALQHIIHMTRTAEVAMQCHWDRIQNASS